MPPPMPPQMPPRPMPAQAGPAHDQYGRYDEPAGFGGYEGSRGGYDGPPVPPGRVGPGGFGGPVGPNGPLGPNGPVGPGGPGGFGSDDRFGYGGFEPGRHGKPEMTTDIRRPDRDPRIGARGPAPVPMGPPPMAGPQMGPAPMGAPPMAGPPPGAGGGGEVQRVDAIRRSLQVRRFGSGYDPDQVNRFFDQILTAMSGRGPMPVNPADLPATRFGLVPGGYFEAEVEAALRQVQDILRRR